MEIKKSKFLYILFPLIFIGQLSVYAFVIPSASMKKTKNDYIVSSFMFSELDYRKRQSLCVLSARWGSKEKRNLPLEISATPPPSVSKMAVVRRSLPLYLLLLGLNILTFLDVSGLTTTSVITSMIPKTMSGEDGKIIAASVLNNIRTVFFGFSAVLTAYLGAEQQDIGQTQAPITNKNAVIAPLFAGGTLFILYLIIQYTKLNPGLLYRGFTSLFGWICFTELLQPLLALSPLGIFLAKQIVHSSSTSEQKKTEEVDEAAAAAANGIYFNPPEGETQSDVLALRACEFPAAILSISVVLTYWMSVTNAEAMATSIENLRTVAFTNNFIAGSIGLITLGQIAIESYVAGSALLSGLFLYDALSVFKSDAMVTVATTIEAPVKLLFAGNAVPPEGKYPFAVLGLGDIVIPGVFIAMLRQFDIENWYSKNTIKEIPRKKQVKSKKKNIDKETMVSVLSSPEPSSDLYQSADTLYFKVGLVSYVVGLGLTFAVLTLTGKGQPALFYIVPSMLLGSSGTALVRRELSDLWSYKGSRAAAASEARKDALEKQKQANPKRGKN